MPPTANDLDLPDWEARSQRATELRKLLTTVITKDAIGSLETKHQNISIINECVSEGLAFVTRAEMLVSLPLEFVGKATFETFKRTLDQPKANLARLIAAAPHNPGNYRGEVDQYGTLFCQGLHEATTWMMTMMTEATSHPAYLGAIHKLVTALREGRSIYGFTPPHSEEEENLIKANVQAIDGAAEWYREQKKTVDELVLKVRETLTEKTISDHEQRFVDAAVRHRWFFITWSVSALLTVIGMLLYTWCGVEDALSEWKNEGAIMSHLWPLVIPRMVTYAIASIVLAWLIRSAGAERHNWIVNRHRAHALGTYQNFVSGAADPRVSQVMLVNAANAVFTHQPSGFLKEQPDQAPPAQILEILKQGGGNE